MSDWIFLLNGGAVGLFGCILSASFCNALTTERKRRGFWCFMAASLLMQGGLNFFLDAKFFRQIYPLAIHLPLVLVLSWMTGKWLWSLVSFLTAYLCCQPRRWLALLVVTLSSGGEVMRDAVELAVTLPWLLLLLRFVSPAIRQLSSRSPKIQCQFGVIPALYYVFDYVTVVYTGLLFSGNPVVVEFMSVVCCGVYLAFLLYHSAGEQERSRLWQVQKSLDIQLSQSVREIAALRESQDLARQYRHDLRHHLQYVSACIENGQAEEAQAYIYGICQEIEAQRVRQFCENESVNLILSAFDGRAAKEGITMNVRGALPALIGVSDRDLCVLLSNALENALHACLHLTADIARVIDVQFYLRGEKFFLQIRNPCVDQVRFEHDVPVSDLPGHGIGVQSICAIVERYGGIYSFLLQDGQFILRLSI